MKKLLALLTTALVIGSVFAGPVHINGPGINTGDIYEFAFGVYYNKFSGSSGLPLVIAATQIAAPDSQNIVLGDAGQSQEVISLSGCSKPAYTGNVLS
jgi:hypothetical protein